MLKVYFYLADGPDEPIGGEEFWLTATPRIGESVCIQLGPPAKAMGEECWYGKVVDIQWTVQQRDDGNSKLPDWVTVDVWLEQLSPHPSR
jgi:hypothetical protein